MLIAQTTSDLIADALREDIQSGETPPGTALRQEDLAKRFSVSRIPVREALRALERDGLVQVHPNRGAFVVELTVAQIRENIELRILLEGELIAKAVPAMTAEDLRLIAATAAAGDAASSTAAWSEADQAFHETLYRPAARPQHLALVISLRNGIARYWSIYGQLPQKRLDWLADHAEMVAACRAGDAEGARRIVTDHIARAGEFLVERLERAGKDRPARAAG